MIIPNKLPIEGKVRGSTLKRTLNAIIDAVKSNRVTGDGKTNRANRTPAGTTLSIIREAKTRAGGSGTTIRWAKVTAVTDANNYTVNIYNRADESTALASSKQMRVFDLVDSLAVNDWVPVQTSSISGEDYECIQQMGAVG